MCLFNEFHIIYFNAFIKIYFSISEFYKFLSVLLISMRVYVFYLISLKQNILEGYILG